MQQENEFKALGMNMTAMTIGYGLLLIGWGAALYMLSGQPTAAIPGIFGLPILIAGLLAKTVPAKRKIWMHIGVLFGLLCFLGGASMIVKAVGSDAGLFANQRKAASFIMMAITGLIYTVSCVRSFIWARKNPPADTSENSAQ